MPTGQRHALPTVTKVESSKYTTGSHYVVSKFSQSCPKLVPKSLLILKKCFQYYISALFCYILLNSLRPLDLNNVAGSFSNRNSPRGIHSSKAKAICSYLFSALNM